MPGTKLSAAERILDLAIEFTFPASDPIAVEHAFPSARKREQTFQQGESVMAAKSGTRG